MELELARTGSSTSLSGGNATRQRRHYASLDPMSMGVDVQVGPVMNLGSPDFDNNRCVPRYFFKTRTLDRWEYQYNVCVRDFISRGVLDNYGTSVDIEQRKSAMERQGTDSSSVDTGSPSASESSCPTATGCDSEPERNEDQLPPGWEKHEGRYCLTHSVTTSRVLYFKRFLICSLVVQMTMGPIIGTSKAELFNVNLLRTKIHLANRQ